MKRKGHFSLFLLALLAGIVFSSGAQEAISAAGGTAKGQGGSVSFTVGQVIYTFLSGREQSVIQGVQQPYEILVVTFSGEMTGYEINVQAYPNPTTDFTTLKVETVLNQQFQTFNYELIDVAGRVLKKNKITSSQTNIRMNHLSSSTYFLKVYYTAGISSSGLNSSVQSKTFKIIKK